MKIDIPKNNLKRVVIIGGGFAGLTLAKKINTKQFQVVLIDKNNYHLFPPLLYQVATADLPETSIAFPFRKIFKDRKNFFFRMAEVKNVNNINKTVETSIGKLNYDFLIIATGSTTNFYGVEGLTIRSMPMKSIREALNIRSMILQNFEAALSIKNKRKKQSIMNYVIAGAGPTGVELAGALGEIKQNVLPKEYPKLNSDMMQITLIQGAQRILPAFSEKASEKAMQYLQKLGVKIQLNSIVTDYFGDYIQTHDNKDLVAHTLIWTAGVIGNPIDGLEQNIQKNNRRISVDEYNRVLYNNNIFAIGDIAFMQQENYPAGHPMVAQVAIQQATTLAKNIQNIAEKKPLKKFSYKDKGAMATIGKNKAIVETGKFTSYGRFAWYLWMLVHLLALVGFNHKIKVFLEWARNYFSKTRGVELILHPFDFGKEKKQRKKELIAQ